MREIGSFEIEFDTEENALKAGECIKAYIYEQEPKGYEWTGSPADDGWAEGLTVDECNVWTESEIIWNNFDLLAKGIASLLDSTMRDSVVSGSFNYLNEVMGNTDRRTLVVSDEGISIADVVSLTDCYNNWSALSDDREWIRNQILKEGNFGPDDLDAYCVLCSAQYRQQAFETLLGDISDEELEQVKDYYLDTLADVDDNLVDEIENDTPRQACMKVLEQYWKENAEDFDTLEEMLMSICEECRCDVDVELVEPEMDDEQNWFSCADYDDENEENEDDEED